MGFLARVGRHRGGRGRVCGDYVDHRAGHQDPCNGARGDDRSLDAVIGTLVGTYFGIKAGLDGQDKVKETVSRAMGEGQDRLRVHTERDGDRRSGRQPAEEQQQGTRERKRVEPEERQGWEGVGV